MHDWQAPLSDWPRQATAFPVFPVLLPFPPVLLFLLLQAESAAKQARALATSQCEDFVMTRLLGGRRRTGSHRRRMVAGARDVQCTPSDGREGAGVLVRSKSPGSCALRMAIGLRRISLLPVSAMPKHRSVIASAFAFCLIALSAARPAHAFCRTTTSQVPSGYDPAANGCWTQGIPLAWPQSRVPMGIISAASSQISLAEARRVEDLALSAWNHVLCSGGPANIQVYDDSPIAQVPQSCTSSEACDPATHDYLVFDDAGWPHDDPTNALGLTTVTFGVDDGRIFAAYTEINTAEHTIAAQEPPPSGTYDLQGILTHETGHFLGLAHATDSRAVMYAYYRQGATQLTTDDENGLCAIYPPQSSGDPSGCAVRPLRSGRDASGALAAALVALAIVRRTRCRSPRRAS